jgi:hypothetical protein
MSRRIYVVDRIERGMAVLVDDDGRTMEVVLDQLPSRLREGTVLRVPVEAGDRPSWRDAVIDERERVERLREGEKALKELKKRDPGGDVSL